MKRGQTLAFFEVAMMQPPRTLIRLVRVTACAAALTCDSSTKPPVPTAITAHSGNHQIATVATAVTPSPAVLVLDNRGGPAAGVTVTFAVHSGGGTVSGPTQTSGANGIATVGSWTLGTTTGANTLTATSTGLVGSPVTFIATGIAATASVIEKVAGDNQNGTAGSALIIPPSVKVTDIHGNAVANVSVTFAIASGGGIVGSATQTTGADGTATVGSWTLGTTAGTNTLTASASGVSGTMTFTAIGTPGPPSAIELNGGNSQTATVATALVTNPSVKVSDANGNAVAGRSVTFAVASGGGNITGATQSTGGDGIAMVGSWTLGTTAGANTLTATSSGLVGSPVTFTATGIAGPATSIAKIVGDNQSAVVGTTVITRPGARVTDVYSNPVTGTSVTFAVAGGGGSVTGATQTSNAIGVATVGSWTLGCVAGANSLSASATGLNGSPVTFIATATAAPAVAEVSVVPTSFGILIGDTVTLMATPKDASAHHVPCTSTTWGPPSSSSVTVSSAGMVTGVSRGFAGVPATVQGISKDATMSVYSAAELDSVRFAGWTETNQSIGDIKCVDLATFDPNNITNALRWTQAVSDSTVMRVRGILDLTPGQTAQCFEALKAGTVTVFGLFGGQTAQKSITIP